MLKIDIHELNDRMGKIDESGDRPWPRRTGLLRQMINARRKELQQEHHPDKGGDQALSQEINAAADRLLKIELPVVRQVSLFEHNFAVIFGQFSGDPTLVFTTGTGTGGWF